MENNIYLFLIIFFVLSIVNVIGSTVKSILLMRDSVHVPAFSGACYFAFYNIMLQYTVADFPMFQKCIITFICNYVGIAVVKYLEKRLRKDKLWEVKMTVSGDITEELHRELSEFGIPHSFIDNIGKHSVFTCYCATKADSSFVKEVGLRHNAKFFVSENKSFL